MSIRAVITQGNPVVLAIELSPWRGARKGWIGLGAGLALAAGVAFVLSGA